MCTVLVKFPTIDTQEYQILNVITEFVAQIILIPLESSFNFICID